MPKASRFTVTLITGGIATVAGMFPAITMKLLDFVALYGMLLMPMGAVIFVDFWLIRKFGLQSSYAERSGATFNWAAGAAWLVTLAIASVLVKFAGLQIFFVSLPGWFIAATLYVGLSVVYQKKSALPSEKPSPAPPWHKHRRNHMRTILIVVAVLSLVLLMLPSILFLAGRMELDTVKWIMMAATIVWFATATPWLWKRTG